MSSSLARSKRLISKGRDDQRDPFQRDRDRILYTDAFRRLSGVTQVARAEEAYTYHDRLSHSLKVAQIGRRLAEFLPELEESNIENGLKINPDVTETAALAHDLGHPPFGHVAEETLNQKISGEKGVQEGFEGNAQSFRIVNHVASHNDTASGLNLTLASLNGILKYPWMRSKQDSSKNRWGVREHEKWGVYESERDAFEQARSLEPVNKRKSGEADIMDWADDLAYAVHDMEDFYRSGLLPLEQLLKAETTERRDFLSHVSAECGVSEEKGAEILDWLRNQGGSTLLSPFRGTKRERRKLDYLSSTLIRRYVGVEKGGVYLQDTDTTEPYLQIDEEFRDEVKILKEMTVYYVIDDSALRAQQRGQQQIIGELFDILFEAVDPDEDEDSTIIPSPFFEEASRIKSGDSDRTISRIVADIITSMTEKQAVKMYDRLVGHSPGSIQERIMY